MSSNFRANMLSSESVHRFEGLVGFCLGLSYMTSTEFWYFITPSPSTSAKYQLFVCKLLAFSPSSVRTSYMEAPLVRVDRRQRHRVPREEAGRAAARRPVSSFVVGNSVVVFVVVVFEIAAREDRGNAVRAAPSLSGVARTPLPLIPRSKGRPLPRCPLRRSFV